MKEDRTDSYFVNDLSIPDSEFDDLQLTPSDDFSHCSSEIDAWTK